MTLNNYSAKLTGANFLYNETKIIGDYLLNGEDPKELRKRNIEENLIKYKSPKAISRVNSPIFERLNVIHEEMLEEFVNGDLENSRLLLVYAIMKTDNLVCDFITEIYKDRILRYKEYIEQFEINDWFENIYVNSNLCNVSETTKYKLKQVMMRIMIDSGLVKKEEDKYKILIPILSSRFEYLLTSVGDVDYYRAIGGII
jgi:hypothetical protein